MIIFNVDKFIIYLIIDFTIVSFKIDIKIKSKDYFFNLIS